MQDMPQNHGTRNLNLANGNLRKKTSTYFFSMAGLEYHVATKTKICFFPLRHFTLEFLVSSCFVPSFLAHPVPWRIDDTETHRRFQVLGENAPRCS
jgi:hypothetical protein